MNGFADVLECPNFDGRFYCGLGNSSTCQTEHTFHLADGYFADFRNASAGPGPAATVTVFTAPVDPSCTDRPKVETGHPGPSATAGVNGNGKGTKVGVPASPTPIVGDNGTAVLQSYTTSAATSSASVLAFNSTNSGDRVIAVGLSKGLGLLLAGGMLLL